MQKMQSQQQPPFAHPIQMIERIEAQMQENNDYQDQNQNYDYYISMPALQSQSSQYSQPPILSYSYSGISNASSTPQFTMHSSRVSEEQIIHFIFHKPQKMYTCLQKLIKEVKEVIMLEEDFVVYVLFKYQWSKDRLYEGYYAHSQTFVDRNQRLRNAKDAKVVEVVGVCEVCENSASLLTNPICQHSFCYDCWKCYLSQCLQSNSPFPPCMQNCPDSPLLTTFTQKNFPQLFDLHRKIICINYASINKSITYCPNDKCQLFCQRVQAGYDIYVECPCSEIFCFFCRKEPHYPATCDDLCKWVRVVNQDTTTSQWIQKNTKRCPQCKQSVEKYIGCSKIKCVCGAEFCYECNAKWDERHKSSKGECLSLSRKSSLQQRASTTAFLLLHQKSLSISRTLKRHMQILSTILEQLKQQWITKRLEGLRKQIHQAWQALKWGNILCFLYKRNQIDINIQQDYIEALGKLMEAVQKFGNLVTVVSPKDVIAVGDEVALRREGLKKNRDIWFQAWRNCH